MLVKGVQDHQTCYCPWRISALHYHNTETLKQTGLKVHFGHCHIHRGRERPMLQLYSEAACHSTLPKNDRYFTHYDDFIMTTMASQITSLIIVYSTVYSGADQRKHQSSASLAFVRGIHRGPVDSPHKWPVAREMFPFDDVIMCRWYFHMQFIEREVLHFDQNFTKVCSWQEANVGSVDDFAANRQQTITSTCLWRNMTTLGASDFMPIRTMGYFTNEAHSKWLYTTNVIQKWYNHRYGLVNLQWPACQRSQIMALRINGP